LELTYLRYLLFSDDKVLPAHSTDEASSRSHPCLAFPIIHWHLLQCHDHGVATSTQCSYHTGISSFQQFCTRCACSPLPAPSLTLQYFCASKITVFLCKQNYSICVSHKTLKVYLCGICLWHIKEGFTDPTSDPLLQLVCRGICCLQSDGCRTCLPITINILHTIKHELRQSHYSFAEQRILWSALKLTFYGFLCVSEYLNLRWSDVVHTNKITITPHQSKTDPFQKCHRALIFLTNTSTCPSTSLAIVCSTG